AVGAERQFPIAVPLQRVFDAEAKKPAVERAVPQCPIIVELFSRRVSFFLAEGLCQRVVGAENESLREPFAELYLHGVIDRTAKIACKVGSEELRIDCDPVFGKASPARNSTNLTRDEVIRIEKTREAADVISGEESVQRCVAARRIRSCE